MIAAPVVLGRSVHGLVDVANAMAEELERRQLLLIARGGRCQHGEVVLDRAHDALVREWALVIAQAGGVQLEECQLADDLVTEAAPGRG